MSIRRTGLPVLLVLASLCPGAAWAQKLDNDDKKFLNDVRPLLTPDEENTFKKLKDKADRVEFQKIFWTRRDPDLATPVNEAKDQYEKDRATADQTYRVPARSGSQTDCGRVFILLGKPDEVQAEGGSLAVPSGLRTPETWIYKDKPGRTFQGGRAAIAFNEECQGTGDLAAQLDRIAASKVTQPNIDYRVKDGRLVKLVDLLPKDTAARQLFKQPREEFKIAVQANYLKVAGGGTALVGLVKGDASGLSVAEAAGNKVVNVSVAASAVGADGQEAGWVEQTMNAPVAADGSFLGSFKMGLNPGKYGLKAGVVDVKGGKASLATLSVEVPNFSQVLPAADGSAKPLLSGTVLVVRQIVDLPPNAAEDTSDPFLAYHLSAARLIPVFASELHKSDTVSFFFQVYDLQVDANGKANGTARLRVMLEGKGQVTASAESAIETPVFGTEIGPVPLEKLSPGKYTARLEATDKIAQKSITVDTPFEILP